MRDHDDLCAAETGAWRRLQLPGLAVLAVLIAGLGMVGFTLHFHATGQELSLGDMLYLSVQLFGLEYAQPPGPVPWQLNLARFLAPILMGLALAKAMVGIFHAELQARRLRRSRGHIVVCGIGRKAAALVRDYQREQRRIVVIDPGQENRLLRACEGRGTHIIHDDASRVGSLLTARAHRAEQVFITTGDDSTNIEIASRLLNLVRTCGATASAPHHRLTCHVHLVDRQTAELFKKHRIFKDAASHVDVRIFNVYDNAARLLWREHLLMRGPLAPDDSRRMHVLIGGLGQMGEAVLLRLVRSAHYANGRKLAVTLVDRQANRQKMRLQELYPKLQDLCDLNFLEAELDQPETARRIATALAGPDQISTVILCLDQDYANFAIALHLAPHLGPDGAHIFVRLSEATGLCELLRAEHSESALARQIDGFGLVNACCTKEAILSDDLQSFARSLHESHVLAQREVPHPTGAPALQSWETLSDEFRESNCEQAEHLEVKLRTFGYSATLPGAPIPQAFTPAQAEILSRMEHYRWCTERWLTGWVYAPGPRDPVRRTTPYLVPWEQLEPAIQKIEFDFMDAVPRILAAKPKISPEKRNAKKGFNLPPSRRLRWALGLLGVLLALGIGWLCCVYPSIKAKQTRQLQKLAEQKRQAQQPVRGRILDTQGRVLAQTGELLIACADPRLLVNAPNRDLLPDLARVLELDAAQLQRVVRESPRHYMRLKKNLTQETAAALRKLKLPGVFVEAVPARDYPFATPLAHVLGCTGSAEEYHALSGMEVAQNKWLSAGGDVQLTLDIDLQTAVQGVLESAFVKTRAKRAQIVVMDTRTGAIRAAAQVPALHGRDERTDNLRPLQWLATGEVFEPGGLLKPLIAATALENGVITPETRINCEGGVWTYEGLPLHDPKACAELTAAEILQKGSNIGMAKIGLLLGNEPLYQAVAGWGLNQRCAAGLNFSESGILHGTNRWSKLEVTRIPIGHGCAVTLLQLLRAYSALFNDGQMIEPTLIAATRVSPGTAWQPAPVAKPQPVIRPATAAWLRTTLEKKVGDGLTTIGQLANAQKPFPDKSGYDPEKIQTAFMGSLDLNGTPCLVAVWLDEPDRDGAINPAFELFKSVAALCKNQK